jgi:miniconductance mechanosensitive channel
MLAINFKNLDKYFEQLFLQHGVVSEWARFFNIAVMLGIIAILAVAANYIFKKIIIRIIKHWVDKSTNNYDDVFYEKGVFNSLSHLAPALLIKYMAPIPLEHYTKWLEKINTATDIYIIIVILVMLNAVINAFHDIYNSLPTLKNRTIKGYVQVVKSIVFFIGALMIISVLVHKDLSTLFGGLAAFAAVLLFVFKDTILGLIAGIQISSNDILRVGDYIEMPGRNADGTIIDISLSVIKIHNGNRTISTVPTYAFVTESFWNWRGLELAAGRRIKRSIFIDMNSIVPCDNKLLEKLRKIQLLEPYFEKHHNSNEFVNLSLYRAYTEAYISQLPEIDIASNVMVRHLQPVEFGLPLEVTAFTKERNAKTHESIQSDIYDHLIAILPEFGLRICQKYNGYDERVIAMMNGGVKKNA